MRARPGRGRRRMLFLALALVALGVIYGAYTRLPREPVLRRGAASGCGARGISPGTVTYQMRSGGVTRTYLLHVPVGYNPDRPTPLVINFHGYTMSGALEERYTGMSALADRMQFVVVYPDGTPATSPWQWLFPQRGWNIGVGYDRPFPVDDERFADDLLALLTRQLCLDTARIYAAGFSNGGGMAAALACAASPRIAALATVAGAFPPPYHGCHPRRPMPVLAIQGTGDAIVPFHGGPSLAGTVPSTAGWAAAWARRNGCKLAPGTRKLAPDVVQTRYSDCPAGAEVVVDAVLGGGHSWPGAHDRVVQIGRTATDFDATRAIWDFFRVHPRVTAS